LGNFVENQSVYFLFDQRFSPLPGQTLFLKINNSTTDTNVSLPYSVSNTENRTLWFNSTSLTGSLDFSPVVSLYPDDFNLLFLTNVFHDRVLMILLGVVLLSVVMILFLILKPGSK
jgi:hypothetical protein